MHLVSYCEKGVIAYSASELPARIILSEYLVSSSLAVDQNVVAFCDDFWNYVGLDEVCNTVEADEGWVKAGIIVC